MFWWQCLQLIVIVSVLLWRTFSYDIAMTAYVDQGYYFSHRCEITIEVVSNYFQTQDQLFHIFALQNANFFNTTQTHNIFYIKGTNSMQAMMTSSETYCRSPMSSTYYCPFISISGYNPYRLKYYQAMNSTHYKLTIRLTRTICPQQGAIMSFRIQMPTHTDYSSFYMFIPNIFNTTPITVSNISFVYDKQVIVDMGNLTYKQVKSISSIHQNAFLVGCQLNYPITFRIDNVSYYNSWDQIYVYVSNSSVVQLVGSCSSNLTEEYSCVRTSYGYNLIRNNHSHLVKSYQIPNQQYYDYPPYLFTLSFGLQFIAAGHVDVEVVVKAINNTYQESWLNMTHNNTEIYGRRVLSLKGYNLQDFSKINQNKYDSSMCLANGSFNNNNTNNNDSTDTIFGTQSIQISQLIFIIIIIVIPSLTLFFTKSVNICEKLLFMITIFLLSLVKIFYLALQVNQTWLASSDPSLKNSLIESSTHTYSLELFILEYTFILQFFLNALYFLNYLILIICSQQIQNRIKKYYGTKTYIKTTLNQIQNKSKINQSNLSSIIFTFVSVLSFLINFKIYALLILKLQVDTNPHNSEFKKYRFRNSVIYKIHCGHLGIDLLLDSNVLIWLFMTIKNCENQIFTVILYIILVIYCLHGYLIAVFLKSFILMARKTDNLNFQQQKKLKNTTQNLQTQHEIEDENDFQLNEIVHENNNPPHKLTEQINHKQQSQLPSNLRPVKNPIKFSTSKSTNSKNKKLNPSNK